jgi:hypothetical protein
VDVTDNNEGWGRARWRLRDLTGRDRHLAVGLFALLVVPFAVAVLRALHDGWIPSGDEASIATRALDVFSRRPPLTGLVSTSALYGNGTSTNHPGPIEFYLMAIPLRLLGVSAGPLFTAATINSAAVLISVWVFFRRLGLNAMLWAGVLLLAVMWSGGTSVLTDTLSSNMTMYSLLCVAVLAWALVDGDLVLLPLAAFAASYSAQQHLAAGLIVIALAILVIASIAVQIAFGARRGHPPDKKKTVRWSASALAVSAVCWTPVAIDEISGHPGNLTAIVRFARDNTRPTLGLKSGFYQVVHALTPPTILGRTDTTGAYFLSAPGALRLALALLIIGALGALAWGMRVEAPAVSRLALVALVLLAAGIVNGSNVPQSIESTRVNLYRWTWALALITFAALGNGIAHFWRRTSAASRASRLGPLALLVVSALIAGAVVIVHGKDDHNRELPEFALEKRIDAAVLSHIDRHRPVLIIGDGSDANLSVVPHLVFRLVNAGVKVEVLPYLTTIFGNGRGLRGEPSAIIVSSGTAQDPLGPGQLIAMRPYGPGFTAQFNALYAQRTALLDQLSTEVAGSKVVLAAKADAVIRHEHSGLSAFVVGVVLANLAAAPRVAFGDPTILRLLLKGVLRSPIIDQSKVQRLLGLPAYGHIGTYFDEQVAVHLLTPAEARICARRPCYAPE